MEADTYVNEITEGPGAGRWHWEAFIFRMEHQVTDMGRARTRKEALAAAETVKPRVEAAYEVLTCTDPDRAAAALRIIRGEGFPQINANGEVTS